MDLLTVILVLNFRLRGSHQVCEFPATVFLLLFLTHTLGSSSLRTPLRVLDSAVLGFTQYPLGSNLKEEGTVGTRWEQLQCIIVKKVWWWESEADAHVVSAVGK